MVLPVQPLTCAPGTLQNEGVARSLFNAFQILATEFQATVLRSPQPLDVSYFAQ